MTDTIRERIIDAVVAKVAEAVATRGYARSCGLHVFRALRKVGPEDLDALVVWPGAEKLAREYGKNVLAWEFGVEGLAEIGSSDPSEVAEQMMGDIVEVMTGRKWSVPFTSGSREIEAGETIEGHTSGATGYVEAVSVSTGAWDDGDAAGTVTIRRRSGTFQAETLDIGAETNVAQTTGLLTLTEPKDSTLGGLGDDIAYLQASPSWPEGEDTTVGVRVDFEIVYATKAGNPFAQ